MRSQILQRLRMLEARLPPESGPKKAPLPEWLMEEFQKEGVRFNSLGLPDRDSWRALSAAKYNGANGETTSELA